MEKLVKTEEELQRKTSLATRNVCRDTERRSIYRDKVMYVATSKEEETLVETDKQGHDM